MRRLVARVCGLLGALALAVPLGAACASDEADEPRLRVELTALHLGNVPTPAIEGVFVSGAALMLVGLADLETPPADAGTVYDEGTGCVVESSAAFGIRMRDGSARPACLLWVDRFEAPGELATRYPPDSDVAVYDPRFNLGSAEVTIAAESLDSCRGLSFQLGTSNQMMTGGPLPDLPTTALSFGTIQVCMDDVREAALTREFGAVNGPWAGAVINVRFSLALSH